MPNLRFSIRIRDMETPGDILRKRLEDINKILPDDPDAARLSLMSTGFDILEWLDSGEEQTALSDRWLELIRSLPRPAR